MSQVAQSYALWLADFYLLSTVLLAFALAGIALLNQPAQRLAIAKSTLVALLLLAVLCAVPGWSLVHLLTYERPQLTVESHRELSAMSNVAAERTQPIQIDAGPAAKQATSVPPTDNTPPPAWTALRQSWRIVLPMTHLAGAGGIAAWLALGWFASKRLRRGAQPASPRVIAILNEVTGPNLAQRERLQLLTHAGIDVAVALGIWRPAILLPAQWTQRESRDHLRAVLAHEWTHVLNRDLQWLAATRLLFVALWANPLFWIARRRLRLDQEALADAAAAELTSRQRYAEQLVAWARNVSSRPAMHLSSAVGLWEGPSQLRQRIAILLSERLMVLRACSRRWRILTAVTSLATAVALSMVTLQPATRADEKSPPPEQSPVKAQIDTKKAESRKISARPEPNTITGRVWSENGLPFVGAEVLLFRINRIDSSRKLQAKKVTGADGRYRFENVIDIAKEFPDGKLFPFNPLEEEFVQVYVRAPERIAQMREDFRQQIARNGYVFDTPLLAGAKLSGRVTGPDGKPVGGALVSVGGSGYAWWDGAASAQTKADGTYVISDAPPYGMEEYRKVAAERNRQKEALRATKKDSYSFYVPPPLLTVVHPNFAIKRAIYEKIPGTQDVSLDPAAVVEGRILYGDTAKPAAGVIVHLNTSAPKDAQPNEDYMTFNYYAADARTDAEGKYRFASLPPGNYDVSAEMPGWVNAGHDAFAATADKTSTAPNLTLTKGGTISIRLIDDRTGKPIVLTPDLRAGIAAHEFPLPKGISRPAWTPNAAANSAGRFELHALPGKRAVFVSLVHAGEKLVWAGKTSPGELKPLVVDLVEGKTVEVDIPVVEMNEAKATGTFGTVQVAPSETPKPPPKTKSSSDRAADRNDGASTSTPKATSKTAQAKSAAPKTSTGDKDEVHTEMSIVVAKNVLLQGGKEIIT